MANLSAYGQCNWYYRTNLFQANVMLNTNRFPNGAWTYVRYAYRRIGTTTWHTTNFYGPTRIHNYTGTTGSDPVGPGQPIYQPKFHSYYNAGQYGGNGVHASSCWVGG